MTEDRNRSLLEMLIGISREIAGAPDLRTVLQRLMLTALEHVGGERGSIVVLDDLGKPLDATIVYGSKFIEHTAEQLSETTERGLAGWVISQRKAARVPDTSRDERWLHRVDDDREKSGAKSAICVPLLARDKLVGVLTLVHSSPNSYNETHLELAQAIADQASVAVLNARLYTESQRTARVMSALAESAAVINISLEMPEVWQRILNQTMHALQVETVGLALIESGDDNLVFRASAGHNAGNLLGRKVQKGAGLVGLVVEQGHGVIISDVSQDKRFGEADKFSGIKTRSLAIAPIQVQGKVIGVIEAINPISGTFDPDANLVLTGLGNLAGISIHNAQFMERLQVAHQRYRELFAEGIDAGVVTDWDGRITEANRQAALLSGYDLNELRALSIDQVHEVNWNKTGLEFEILKEAGEATYESDLHRKDGGTTPVEVIARRVKFEETDSARWTLRDISARKELDALREDMTAMIYHDLRSPLGNIISSLDMLDGMLPKDESMHSILAIASNSAGRIQRMVSSLLDISRLESGQPIADQNAVDPLALLREALHDVHQAADRRSQKIEAKTPAALPLIWVDVDMIHRVLINLLENASKYSPNETVIRLGAEVEGTFVKISVKDQGPGIAPADQQRIFDKFTRIGEKTQPSGLGIGLAFCKLAVEGHGGEIKVQSELKKGTTVIITLPIAIRKQAGTLVRRQTGRLSFKEKEG